MNLRLFAIRSLTTNKIIPDLFFADKGVAKTERDKLGKESHCVTYGPDHRNYRG